MSARGLERLGQYAGVIGGPAALRKSHDPEHADRTVERDGEHIAGPHRTAGPINAPAIDANVARGDECRRIRARAHDPRMPKPLVDALAVQALSAAPCCRSQAVP